MGGDKIRRLTAKGWRNQTSGKQVIVPYHGNQSLPLGTLRNILTNAEIPEFEWKN